MHNGCYLGNVLGSVPVCEKAAWILLWCLSCTPELSHCNNKPSLTSETQSEARLKSAQNCCSNANNLLIKIKALHFHAVNNFSINMWVQVVKTFPCIHAYIPQHHQGHLFVCVCVLLKSFIFHPSAVNSKRN